MLTIFLLLLVVLLTPSINTMLALFPLNLVVFPNENLNLHIFEPRYKELITNCLDERKTFGIPVFINNRVQEYGTEVKIIEVAKQYADGRMDIKTKGQRIFRLQTFANPMADKLYAGGEVEFIEIDNEADPLEKIWFTEVIAELYEILGLNLATPSKDSPYLSFEYAHKIGLSQQQEYELLSIQNEGERLRFLTEHLRQAIPVIREVERSKAIIRMNGHFKNLDPLKF